VVLPSAIQFPQYGHVLAYIPQRLSLFTALAFCLMVRGMTPGKGTARLSGVVAAMFFAFLYFDQQAFNSMETTVTRLIQMAPSGQRVVAVVNDSGARLNALGHVADRACIGHCFSYANYEPPTKQFRIRLQDGNHMNVPSVAVAQEIERGEHIVTPEEDPIYAVCTCSADTAELCLRAIHAGERVCTVSRPISFRLWRQAPSALAKRKE